MRASQNLGGVPPAFESLMFAIYYAAVTSIQCSVACQSLLHEERQILLDRYRIGVEQALAKANFLSAPNMPSLQALTLYLICARQSVDKAYVWTMTGLAIRLATKLGLHRDPISLGLSPFMSEMRRRLWWQICILDVRTAEDNDMDPVICEHNFDTKFPANVNDLDLDINMVQPLSEARGRTEMLFSLARFEISYAARKLVFSPKFTSDNGYTSLSLAGKNDMIDALQKELEEKYVASCDTSIPICFLTTTSLRMVLAKIKLTINHPARNGSSGLSQDRLVDLVKSSIAIIEYAHTLRSSEKYSRWVWLFQKYTEWDAVAFLLHCLSAAPLPALVERAWEAIDTFFKEWQGHVVDGERRWRRLETLQARAAVKRNCPFGSAPENHHDRAPSAPVPGQAAFIENAVNSSTHHLEYPTQRDNAVSPSGNHSGDPFTLAGSGPNFTLPETAGDYIDWNFDNILPATQGASSWEMDIDENAFNLWH